MQSTELTARLASSSAAEIARGLLGRIRVVVHGLVVEDVLLRKSVDGYLALSWPVHLDSCGRRRPCVTPIDAEARRRLDAEVLAAIGIKAEGER